MRQKLTKLKDDIDKSTKLGILTVFSQQLIEVNKTSKNTDWTAPTVWVKLITTANSGRLDIIFKHI